MPTSTAGRIAAVVAAAIALLLLASQLFLPGVGEGAIEDRLTEGGGSADVSLSALPAARLLWGDGDRIEVRGSGLDLAFDREDPDVFDDLDRFGEVDVALTAFRAGPFDIDSFVLRRDGGDAYSLESSSTTTISDLAEYGAEEVGVPGSGFLDFVLDLTQVGGQDLPVVLDMEMVSDDGRIRVVEGGGEVAGVPTGPLAELLTTAIVVRL